MRPEREKKKVVHGKGLGGRNGGKYVTALTALGGMM